MNSLKSKFLASYIGTAIGLSLGANGARYTDETDIKL
jgi:hypothetical protein